MKTMKFSSYFFHDLETIITDAFKEKEEHPERSIQEIVKRQFQIREIMQDDVLNCVSLTIEEAQEISFLLYRYAYTCSLLSLGIDPDKKIYKRLDKFYGPLNKKLAQAMKLLHVEMQERLDEIKR